MKSLKKFWPYLFLTVLAFIIHFAFLSSPAQVVFDEVHFGKFVSAYSTGQYYFDIHPPLGKLMIAGFVKIAGLNLGSFDFDHIGEQASPQMFFVLRFLPALFGALFVPLFAWLAWLISKSKIAAFFAGFLILFDTAFLVQSRFILVDIFLIFFGILTFCFFFLWQRQKIWSAKWFVFLILTGVSFGLTVSIKWTGLATLGIIAATLLAKIFSKKIAGFLRKIEPQKDKKTEKIQPTLWLRILEPAVGLLLIIVTSFCIYLLFFYIHFSLLPKSGPGDAFMSSKFQQEIKYGRQTVSQPLTFWQKFIELNQTMYTANAGITAEHSFGSRWYSWPFNKKPIYYWNQDTQNASARIYFLGNPVIWWTTDISLLLGLGAFLFKKYRKKIEPSAIILIFAYFANLLPFIAIKRVSFLYHYLFAVTFAILFLSLGLAKFWPREKEIIIAFLFLSAAIFIFLMPLCYGWPLPPTLDRLELSFVGFFR